MSGKNNNTQNARTQGLEDLPVLRLLKEPVEHLSELLVHYPAGGAYGWFAWVNSARTFAYWDTEDKTWKLMGVSGGGGGGGGGTTPSASLQIPNIRVSTVKQGNTRQPDRLMVEPFFMPAELAGLNPRIVVLRRRAIKGTFTRRNVFGRHKRCKRKWCYVEPRHTRSQQGTVYATIRELRQRLSIPISKLSISSANTGTGNFRPERGLLLFFNNADSAGIRTIADFGALFTAVTSKGIGLNTRGTFRNKDFKTVTPTTKAGVRGIIGFALEVDNPDRGNSTRGDSSRPKFLRGAVCEMLLSVNFVHGRHIYFSLVPR